MLWDSPHGGAAGVGNAPLRRRGGLGQGGGQAEPMSAPGAEVLPFVDARRTRQVLGRRARPPRLRRRRVPGTVSAEDARAAARSPRVAQVSGAGRQRRCFAPAPSAARSVTGAGRRGAGLTGPASLIRLRPLRSEAAAPVRRRAGMGAGSSGAPPAPAALGLLVGRPHGRWATLCGRQRGGRCPPRRAAPARGPGGGRGGAGGGTLWRPQSCMVVGVGGGGPLAADAFAPGDAPTRHALRRARATAACLRDPARSKGLVAALGGVA